MAISSNSKIDFLWKKVIFGASKTDSDTAKAGNNESVPSPLPLYGGSIWAATSEEDIPPIPPTVTTANVSVLKGNARIKCDADTTSGQPGARPSWFTGLVDWIPPTFGSGYAVEVYLGDPSADGVQIFPGTTDQEWVFDYSSGVLHFPTNLPTANSKWSQGVYIRGYRYIGSKGVGRGAPGSTGATGRSGLVSRNSFQYVIPDLGVDSIYEFELNLGPAIIVYNLTVSKPILIEVFGTPTKDEVNPYTFLGVEDHLTDDGTTKLSDGTLIKTRQYSIFANLEDPVTSKMYVTVTNMTDSNGPIVIDLLYFAAVAESMPEAVSAALVGKFVSKVGATGIVDHDFSKSDTFYHSAVASNFTVRVTNLSLEDGFDATIYLIIDQGEQAFMPTSFQIASTPEPISVPISWTGGIVPIGAPNKKNHIKYTMLHAGGSYIVLGEMTTFG